MRLSRLLLRLSILGFFSVSACTSSKPRRSDLDQALAALQAGRSSDAQLQLEQSCQKGTTGACALIGRPVVSSVPLSILQSVTTANQTRVVIVLRKDLKPAYYLRGKTLEKLNPERITRGGEYAVDRLDIFNLDPQAAYELIAVSEEAMLMDRRRFRSLDTSKTRARLGVVSCMDDKFKDLQAPMWKQLLEQKLDVLFLLGDNVYIDSDNQPAEPETIWRRHIESRNSLGLYQADPLVPTLATWDDHDYGKADGDRTYSHKNSAREIFQLLFPQDKPTQGFEPGPGVSGWWSAFGVQFAFLDDRSFRSPNRVDLPDQTHFGVDQERWIAQHLQSAVEPVFLISGDQFFGGYHSFESYQGSHPKSFAVQLTEWKKAKVPLVFISGDRHLTEVLKIKDLGYTTYELTSSPLHAATYQDAFKRSPSPNQVVGVAGQANYMVVELMRRGKQFTQFDVQSFGLNGKHLYQKAFKVKHP